MNEIFKLCSASTLFARHVQYQFIVQQAQVHKGSPIKSPKKTSPKGKNSPKFKVPTGRPPNKKKNTLSPKKLDFSKQLQLDSQVRISIFGGFNGSTPSQPYLLFESGNLASIFWRKKQTEWRLDLRRVCLRNNRNVRHIDHTENQ